MLLHADPSLAEVPGFSPKQLEALSRSVELKKQKLEHDIADYIRRKQDELRSYERELVDHYRSMERAASTTGDSGDRGEIHAGPTNALSPSNPAASAAQPPSPSADPKKPGPEERAKRPKHTRVHKREKELCGLVTPIFLPLLDAGEVSPTKKKDKKKKPKEERVEGAGDSPPIVGQGSPSGDAERGKENRRSRSKNSEGKMAAGDDAVGGDGTRENQRSDGGKKTKRSAIKKSSLRNNGTPRTRRKRVSLVIDDQIVHPADNVADAPLTSPSETVTSTASNSTASLDDAIDPRLVARTDIPAHQDPVHHSLPMPMTLPAASPTKHTGHTLSDSPPSLSPTLEPSLEYLPPQTQTRTLLTPSPPTADLDIPQHAGPAPIYANALDLADRSEEDFSSYVGGLSGSGVDGVDQAGSYGYPSSLGASYLESYMQSRPLSVRMAAAEKAGLDADEKAKLLMRSAGDEDAEVGVGRVDDVDEGMEVIGSMEGF